MEDKQLCGEFEQTAGKQQDSDNDKKSLEEREEEIKRREEELDIKEKKLNTLDEKVRGAKNNIYSHINVSLKTMDRVIIILVAVLVVCLIAGIITR